MRAQQTASFSFYVVSLVLFVSCQPRVNPTHGVLLKTQVPAKADAERMRRDITLLASASFEGRGPSSAGLTRAAEFIAKEFEAARLLSVGDDGYWSNFEAPAIEEKPGVLGEVLTGEKAKLNGIGRLVSFGGVPRAEVEGDVVYSTFGSELGLTQVLQGKIALLPEGSESGFSVEDLKQRINRAIQCGAIAVLTVPHELYPPPLDPPSLGILSAPVARLHPSIAARWLRGVTLEPTFTLLPVRLSLRFAGRRLTAARNVFGGLPGRGDKAKAILISAHYDHIGMGRPNWDETLFTLHPGADDNASGTAALLELARIIAALPSCERPIFFVAYSHEEEGLLGSEAFVERMKHKIELVINLDMVGRRHGNAIEINGKPSKTMRDALNKALANAWFYGAPATPKEGPQSDHTTFLLRGIPAMTLTTGLHQDHHQPTDTPDKLDILGATEIVDAATVIARALACQ
jgi:aminopeptidase YwaD